jgi:hypothetical protein
MMKCNHSDTCDRTCDHRGDHDEILACNCAGCTLGNDTRCEETKPKEEK